MEMSWETVKGMEFKSSISRLQIGKELKTKLHVVSCYAPMLAPSREVIDDIFRDLDSTSLVSRRRKYVILDDLLLIWGPGSFRGPMGVSERAS